jgi:large subunit ribosomal protein L40
MQSPYSLSRLLRRPSTIFANVSSAIRPVATIPSTRAMSTTSALAKGPAKGAPAKSSKPSKTPKQGGRKKNQVVRSDAYERVKILKQNMFSAAPPPLRMARLRWLRHWTIHRAWQLFRRQQREATLKERYRMHAGMYNACEELRKTVGPGNRSEGYLYRVAMEKKGVWGTNAIPIEYARLQTDFPGKQAWNHDWKR